MKSMNPTRRAAVVTTCAGPEKEELLGPLPRCTAGIALRGREFVHLEDVAKHLERRAQQRGLRYILGLPASPGVIAETEARLGVVLPGQVARFYQHYDGLLVEDPPLDLLPLARLAFVAPQHLHFATIAHQHQLCFDVSRTNEAGQWDIVTLAGEGRVTLTIASFWSNKLWAWLDKGRAIWQPEPIVEG